MALETLTLDTSSSSLRPFDMRRDLEAVVDLVELCFDSTLDEAGRRYLRRMRAMAQNPAMLRWTALTAEFASAPLSGYVWEQDGRLVGNTSLVPYFIKGRRFYLIANVAVHPDYRRQGIARQLTRKAVERARARGISAVWLHVRQENHAAIALYQEQGFIERTRRTTWVGRGTNSYVASTLPPGAQIGPARASHWQMMRSWMGNSYPLEYCWHMPIRPNTLRPGLWGALYRLISGASVQSWAATLDGKLQAALSWHTSIDRGEDLWLAAPTEGATDAVQALMEHAHGLLRPGARLNMEYPAGEHGAAIRAAGFREVQTLNWMALPLG